MTATEKDRALAYTLERRLGVCVMPADANTLRRAALTLTRWAELECGDGDAYGSWAIERDDAGDGPPYLVRHHYGHGRGPDRVTRTRIPDLETGALRRVRAVCDRLGLSFFHQTDPRGCPLYLALKPLTDSTYSTDGIAVPVE